MNNLSISNSLWKFFPIIIFVFSPKIDLINIPGFWQGIRLDDIIILLCSIYFLISNKFKIYPNLINSQIFGFNFIIFFPYIVFSILIGKIFGINPSIIIILRYCEYIALIIILNQLNPPKEKIIFVFKIYILFNFLIVLFQYFDLIGGFTSRGGCIIDEINSSSRCYDKDDITSICFLNCGYDFIKNYQPAGQFLLKRVPGITGGSWELSINLAISFFGLVLFEKNLKKLIPYFLMILMMLIIAQSRGIIFGFLAGSFFILKDYKKTFKITICIIIFLSLIYFLNFFNFREIFNNKFLLDYFALTKLIISIFNENLPSADTFIGTGLESMYWRAESWHKSIGALENNYLIFFGKGGSNLYEESIIIRVITTYGIIGAMLILYLMRKLPLFFIVFLLVTGLTIDLFISFKIFLFTCLFLIIYFKNKKEIIRR